jgi:uncharacterized protein (DUF488 family)
MSHQILTIGHSNHPMDRFLDLLKVHLVEVVVDTRSHPVSKYVPQFDSANLKRVLPDDGIQYIYMGRVLGGRPQGDQFYDPGGHVLYDKVAESPLFLQGIARLEKGMQAHKVALLCSEEDPSACHRRLLISRVLEQRGVTITHIRGDGRLQPEAELAAEPETKDDAQLALFDYQEEPQWKSIPSVSQKRRQNSSSDF